MNIRASGALHFSSEEEVGALRAPLSGAAEVGIAAVGDSVGTEGDDYLDTTLPPDPETSQLAIYGYGGNDTLIASEDWTYLYGGAGADVFVANSINSASPVRNVIFEDFDVAQGDKVDLSQLKIDNFETLSDFFTAYEILWRDPMSISFFWEGMTFSYTFGPGTIVNVHDLTAAAFTFETLGADDVIEGVSYYDDLFGGLGNDHITQHVAANSQLFGGAGEDTLRATGGGNRLYGGEGDDVLSNAEGSSVLYGGAGDDVLEGGFAAELFGGDGADTLVAVRDGAVLTGGAGADVFVAGRVAVESWYPIDSVTDFSIAEGDRLDISARGISDMETLSHLLATQEIILPGGTDGVAAVLQQRAGNHIHSIQLNGLVAEDIGSSQVILDLADRADLVTGTEGHEDLFGGLGNDHITDEVLAVDVAGTSDRFFGEQGNDTLVSFHGSDTLYGGAGNDELYGGRDGVALYGGAGNDLLRGAAGADSLAGGAGDDTLRAGSDWGNNTLSGGTGADLFVLDRPPGTESDGSAWLQGPDIVTDFSVAEGDRVDVSALGIADFETFQTLVTAHSWDRTTFNVNTQHIGKSVVFEGLASDAFQSRHLVLNTELRNDTLAGTAAGEDLFGGLGNDLLTGSDSASGSSYMFGEQGNDTLRGSTGYTALYGGAGNDVLEVGRGNPGLYGGAGNDLLTGGRLADLLQGGAGNDTLNGESGRDTLTGGEGSDLFVFAGQFGRHTITDFEWGTDSLDFSGIRSGDWATRVVSGNATSRVMTLGANAVTFEGLARNFAATATITLTGEARQGQTLTGSLSDVQDRDGIEAAVISWRWLRDGVAIADATDSTYTLTAADIRAKISVEASFVDDWQSTEVFRSVATAEVARSNFPATGLPVITGSAKVGQVLNADVSGIGDSDGLGSFSYLWLRDGTAIAEATGSSYALTRADLAGRITVQVSYTDGGNTVETLVSSATAAVAHDNSAPNGLLAVSGELAEGALLSVDSAAITDADGLGTFSHVWMRDGVAIEGATAANYTLTRADVGAQISVALRYLDGFGTAEQVLWEAAGPIAHVNMDPINRPAIIGTARLGESLQADASDIQDGDGLGSFAYAWYRDGVAIEGATEESYRLVRADVGARLTVSISYTDDYGTEERVVSAATTAVEQVNAAPSGELVISGLALEGSVLTADSSTIGDADGLGGFSYVWMRDGMVIEGATARSYTPQRTDVRGEITVAVTYVDSHGTEERLVSAPTAPIGFVNSPPTGRIEITGSARQGGVLTASLGTLADAEGFAADAVSWQWLRDGVAVEGATSATHTLGQADVGARLTLSARYTDLWLVAEQVVSSPTAEVENVNDAPSGRALITGAPAVGKVLTADASSIADVDGLGAFSYLWLRNGAIIPAATGPSYQLGEDSFDTNIRVMVRYTDGQGSVETLVSDVARVYRESVILEGTDGHDRLDGGAGNDKISGRNGRDTINGNDGNDELYGGDSVTDLRDVIFGGAGDDLMFGGYGNDELRGADGNDSIFGDHGADYIIGGPGNDVLSGGQGSDEIHGGAGRDYINGGFGHDRLNGGAGADSFFHVGVAGHGSDWIQDYRGAQGDLLVFGGTARPDQFQVNFANTPSAGAVNVAEAFVIHKPTGQILWALVDGQAENAIWLSIGNEYWNLLS